MDSKKLSSWLKFLATLLSYVASFAAGSVVSGCLAVGRNSLL